MKLCLLTALLLAFIAGLGTRPLAAAPTPQPVILLTVTVGNPKQPDALPLMLQDAYKNVARKIVIRPVTYFLPNLDHTVFSLDGWTDTTISAYGVTLILTDLHWTHNAFDLNHCTRVTLAGPVLSQNKITSSQGRISAVGKDENGKNCCDWQPSPGYSVPPADAKKFPSCIDILDAQTHLFKLGIGDFYDVPMAQNAVARYACPERKHPAARRHCPSCVRISPSVSSAGKDVTGRNTDDLAGIHAASK
jgi:hypothetical protein